MSGVIFCPVCKKTISLEVEFDDLVEGFPEDVVTTCPVCKATMVTPVTMSLDIGPVRMTNGPDDAKWLSVREYYADRRLDSRVEPWSVSPRSIPIQFIFGDIHGKVTFKGSTFVHDGYFALRVDDDSAFECEKENCTAFKKFLERTSEDQSSPAEIIARVIGADFYDHKVEDYAAIRDDSGRIIFLLASKIDAILGIKPSLRFLISKCGNLAVIRDGDDLYGVLARIDDDKGYVKRVIELGGAV